FLTLIDEIDLTASGAKRTGATGSGAFPVTSQSQKLVDGGSTETLTLNHPSNSTGTPVTSTLARFSGLGLLLAGIDDRITLSGGSGTTNDTTVTVRVSSIANIYTLAYSQVTPTPEPVTMTLVGGGLLALGLSRRIRKIIRG